MHTVVVPTRNERENLKVLLPELLKQDCEVIVCDNESTDGTQAVARSFGVRLSPGWGTVSDAISRGVQLASNEKIIVMDADMSHPPEKVKEIADQLVYHDMVVGRRVRSSDPLVNRLVSKIGNLLVYGLCPGVQDRMSGFFGIRKS